MARLPNPGSDTGTWGTLLNEYLSVSLDTGGFIKSTALTSVTTRIDVLEYPVLNTQTGTAYTLVLTDANKIVGMNNAGVNTITVPNNTSVAFPIGTLVTLRQVGTGQTAVAGASGVTINARANALKLAGQYAYGTLFKVATNTWEFTGDTTT